MITNRSFTRGSALVATATAAFALLTACGGGESATGHEGMTGMTQASARPAAAAGAQTRAAFNDADVMFAQMMIPHHKQAVEMADLAATRATDQEIKDLAAKIKAAQDPEIATMTGWLTAWGKPVTSSAGMAGHGMPGMMSEDDMAKLKAAKGAEFNRMFAEMMIAHHNCSRGRGRAVPPRHDLSQTTAARGERDEMVAAHSSDSGRRPADPPQRCRIRVAAGRTGARTGQGPRDARTQASIL
ncbi:DUF305 domain-containing protein [Microtetraspora malaysiensis]|uniref:DUF305 domain-containing protein n=1 Tax=Microtetraspora malaysiensis TaxID=161358 RepID=UPI003D94397F